jgi:hypothetical protein
MSSSQSRMVMMMMMMMMMMLLELVFCRKASFRLRFGTYVMQTMLSIGSSNR